MAKVCFTSALKRFFPDLTEKEIPEFVAFCQSINVKPIIIELEAGEVAQQPMISKVFSNLQNGEIHQKIAELKNEFENSI